MRLLTVIFLVLFSVVTRAELDQAAIADRDFERAFQRELNYLSSQRDAMTRMRSQMEQTLATRINNGKDRVTKMSRELASLSADNDSKHEKVVEIEKQRRELEHREFSLQSVFKRATTAINEAEKARRFEAAQDSRPVVVHSKIDLADLAGIFSRANDVLYSMSRIESFEGTYLSPEGVLVQGKITGVGRVAAFAEDDGQKWVLAPNGEGQLQAIDGFEGFSTYVFRSLSEPARIEHRGTWLESTASLAPGVFLALMLLVVGGLFGLMAKI
jgi:hypothetical protein